MDLIIKDLYTCGANIGYNISDIDSDGNDELIIGVASNDEGYSKLVLALYTIKDGAAKNIFTASNRNRYYYVKENLFVNIASNGAADNIDTTLKYANGELTDLEYTTNESSYTQLEYSLLGNLPE